MKHVVQVGDRTVEVDVHKRADGKLEYRVDRGPGVAVEGSANHANELVLRRGERLERYTFDRRKGALCGVSWAENHVAAQPMDAKTLHAHRKRGASGAKGEWEVTAPMPGRVTKLLVQVGQLLTQGDPVVVVEAMKMENELRAPAAGKVTTVSAKEGQAVESGQVLLHIGPAD